MESQPKARLLVDKDLVTITKLAPEFGKVRPSAERLGQLQMHYQHLTVKPLGTLKYNQFQPPLQQNALEELHVGDQIRISEIIIYSNGEWMVGKCKMIPSLKTEIVEGLGIVILTHPTSEGNREPRVWTSALVSSFAFVNNGDLAYAHPQSMEEGSESILTGDFVWFTASKGKPDRIDKANQLMESQCVYTVISMKMVPYETQEDHEQLPGYPVSCLKDLRNPPSTLAPKIALQCINLFWRTLLVFENIIQSNIQKERVLFPAEVVFTQWRIPIVAHFSYSAIESKLNPRKGDTLSLTAFRKNGDTISKKYTCFSKAVVTDCHPMGKELMVYLEFSKNASLDLMLHKVNDQSTVFRIIPVFQDVSLANFKRFRNSLDFVFKHESPLRTIFEMLIGRSKSEDVEPATITPWKYGKDEIPGVGTFEPDAAQLAIFSVLQEKRPLTIIPGPAGVGKTTTLGCILYHELDTQPSSRDPESPPTLYLVMAGSNKAVDVIGKRLTKMCQNDRKVRSVIRPLRIYAPAKEVDGTACDEIALHKIKFQQDESTPEYIRDRIDKYKQLEEDLKQFSLEGLNTTEARMQKDKGNEIVKTMKSIEQLLDNHVLINGNHNVILTTLGNSIDKRLDATIFTRIFVDEAGQATQVELMQGVGRLCAKNEGACVVGDVNQLPPTTLSPGLAGRLLEQSSLQFLLESEILLPFALRKCHRMHPDILQYPNENIYNGTLYCGVSAEERSKFINKFPFPVKNIPIVFCHCIGQEVQLHGYSRHNPREIEATSRIIDFTKNMPEIDPTDIGVLTFYDEHRIMLNAELQSLDVPITSQNIDGSQGDERECVILNCVRSCPEERMGEPLLALIGFLISRGRHCVSVTRARSAFIIVGNAVTLSKDNLWKQLVDHCYNNGLLIQDFDLYLSRLSEYSPEDWYDQDNKLILPNLDKYTEDVVPMDVQ